MTRTTTPAFVETREAWHRVAEHVLAAGQHAALGSIQLRTYPGGFATTAGIDGRHLAVVADQLIVLDGDRMRSRPLTTLRAAAAFAGVELGLRGSYPPATSADHDPPLALHDHTEGSNCCRLRPACRSCQFVQAGKITRWKQAVLRMPPRPSRRW